MVTLAAVTDYPNQNTTLHVKNDGVVLEMFINTDTNLVGYLFSQ